MLATSSSEDEDYDVKKKPGSSAVGGHNSSSNNNNKSFLNASGHHAGPFTPQVQRSNNNNLGADSNSMRSSFSASSENLSQGNAGGGGGVAGGPGGRQRMANNQNMRQASFKSTSSSSTTHGPPGSTHGSSLHPGGHPNLSAPKSPRHNRKNNRPPGMAGGGRRGGPPGSDNYSFSSSLNNGGPDYDSDNSDYQYENHYANQTNQQYYQQSDDENEEDNETVTMSQNEDGSSRSRQQQQQHENEQDKVNALALEAENEAMKEQELHRRKLQIYVLVCRCVAYPFIAKQPTDMVRRQLKITKQQLEIIKENFNTFLNNKMSSIEADEAFTNAVRSYYEVFLKSDRIAKMVASGGCTATDFRDVFKNNIEKRVRSLPEIDGLSKETVLTSWMTKFDSIYRYNEEHSSTNAIAARRHSRTHLNQGTSECILSKEQLYEMFQNLLGVKKFEHQLIFNASQLDNIDEQAATIRRELDSRMKQTENIQKQNGLMPKFVHKNMESTYIEELKQSISLLMNHLDNQPVGASESKLRLPKRPQASKNDHHHHDEPSLSKSEVQLSFAIEVVVMEVKGLKSLPPNRIVFCVMEVEGHGKLQTDQAEASRPIWDTSGDFKTQQPLPVIKVKLCMETQNILQDSKELGRIVLRPDPNFTRASAWYVMDKSNSSKFPDELKIKLTVRIDKPGNLKMCGWCYCMGKNLWKKWKKRYMCLVQVSTYTFALCSYMEKKAEPRELMTLDNFTVDYTDTDAELKSQGGGRFFFSAVKEGDSVTFATDEENERQLWIQSLYRATGQSHKPTPPSANAKAQSLSEQADAERAKKNGMEEYIQADPSKFMHNDLFKMLQQLTLEYRLNDPFCSLGWFSPGQIFVLDEYQARYGVRGCYRHLCYLNDLLDKAEQGYIIDPTLLHYSFAFCACHVHGNRPDGIGTVTNEEKVKFDEIKERLRNLLEYQITHFRYCFPFGRPEGALKQTLSLLERVLMKDIVTPVSPEEVKTVIRKCLEQAALVNYTRISQVAKVEDTNSLYNNDTTPKKKIEDLIHLAELCIDLLQQNEEHHSESFAWFCELLIEHEEIFWSLFAVDMDHVIEQQAPDCWDSFPLFQLLNDYLRNHTSLKDGRFHLHLQELFAPLVIRYIDLMESSIGQSIHKGFEKENWKNRGSGCATSEDMLWKLDALQAFIKDLHWPGEVLAEHLEKRLKEMASDMIEACATRVLKHFDSWLKKGIIILNAGTDYVIPQECCVMVNVIIDCKAQALKLCSLKSGDSNQYHTKIDEFLDRSLAEMKKQIVGKLISVLDGLLKKLSRYDEGTFFSSILSLTKPVNESGQSYVTFINLNLDVLRQKINDEIFALDVFEQWYTEQVNMVCAWLSERLEISLHAYQLACLSLIVKKIRTNFELQGVSEKILEVKTYASILSRLNVEEANQALK